MFMSMVVGAFFMSMVMRMGIIIILFFHVSRRIILVIMMFVPMVVSALLVAMVMCMRIVVVIILGLRCFRLEIVDGCFQFGNVCLDGDCAMGCLIFIVADWGIVLENARQVTARTSHASARGHKPKPHTLIGGRKLLYSI